MTKYSADQGITAQLGLQSLPIREIVEGQRSDSDFQRYSNLAASSDARDWTQASDQSLRFRGRIWIPTVPELRNEIL